VGSWQWVLSNQGCQVTGGGRYKPRPGGDTVLAAPNTFIIRTIDFSDTHNFMYSRPAGSVGGGSPLGVGHPRPSHLTDIFFLAVPAPPIRYVGIKWFLFVFFRFLYCSNIASIVVNHSFRIPKFSPYIFFLFMLAFFVYQLYDFRIHIINCVP